MIQDFVHNGVRCLAIEHPSPIISLRVTVDVGSADEREIVMRGALHLLEHMAFKGIPGVGARELKRLLDLHGNFGAYTDYDKVVFHCECVEGQFAAAAKLLLQMALAPTLPADELEIERTVVLDEINMREDRTDIRWYDLAMEGLLGYHPQVGTPESVRSIGRDDLANWHARWFTSASVVVSIASRLPLETVKAVIRPAIPSLPDSPAVDRPPPAMNFETCSQVCGGKQAMVGLLMAGVPLAREPELDDVPDLLRWAMVGGFSAALTGRLREELGLCYSANCYHQGFANFGVLTLCVGLDACHADRAIAETGDILSAVRLQGFEPGQLEAAKRGMLLWTARRMESSVGVNRLVDAIHVGGRAWFDAYQDFDAVCARVMSVTNEQMIDFARQVLGHDAPQKLVALLPAG